MTDSRFSVLYYPTYEPPADWLRSYLLFFDEVKTIVPNGVEFSPSEDIAKVIDLMPDAFDTVAPENQDLFVDDINLSRLEKAFKQIAEQDPNANEKEIIIEISPEGEVQIMNHVFQHYSKTVPKIQELLVEYDLVIPGLADAYQKPGEYLVVREAASNLILSHIADRVGRRSGVTTVTDQQIDFTVNTLNAFDVTSTEDATSKLATAIIRTEIPREILDVTPQRYKEIREFYRDLREPFHNTVAQLSLLHRLDHIDDPRALDVQVLKLATEFNSQVVKLRGTQFGRQLKHWAPIGVGCVLSLVGAAFHQPLVSASTTAVSIGLQIYRGMASPPPSERERVQRLIGRMQENIFAASPFTAFA
ncbi:MAG TPA: hypothetical protein VFX97_17350 [Pyrinomonadaceae bacterium]|nr:hypothetical protein [Pyrinomonadaceae bacterium]